MVQMYQTEAAVLNSFKVFTADLNYQILTNQLNYTGCPTRYRTQHFFYNFTTNEDIATKFEVDLTHCVRNIKEKNVFLFKFRCNIFTGVRIIKEMPGSVASGTLCICYVCICMHECIKCVTNILIKLKYSGKVQCVTNVNIRLKCQGNNTVKKQSCTCPLY
jgi:hypothetical protein